MPWWFVPMLDNWPDGSGLAPGLKAGHVTTAVCCGNIAGNKMRGYDKSMFGISMFDLPKKVFFWRG